MVTRIVVVVDFLVQFRFMNSIVRLELFVKMLEGCLTVAIPKFEIFAWLVDFHKVLVRLFEFS